ncbi:MAG: hypothetical protein OEU54_11310 [Gemmatimonadota bacterium]|nr:hypothetical protein [Gemmatimonadota bacterium]
MTHSSDGQVRRLPWLRILVEGFVIVGSILLAFGIEAWWQGQGEREEERDGLEILLRDLSATASQLAELQDFAQEGTNAALGAYAALSGDLATLDRGTVSDQLIRSLARLTMQLPRAGYSDLLSTGTLGLIRDRSLRDAIVQFYEQAERLETVFEKNTAVYLDGHLQEVLIRGGLLVLRPTGVGTGSHIERDQLIRERLGDIRHPPDPLWDLPGDARELDRLRSVLLATARATQMQALTMRGLIRQVDELQTQVRSSLE